ncbi:response regulator [Hymenobacter sp. B1770]|uniref:response regulator n=1 Tax=Hymenobacter sp. B1770 TaxID=1718788 RepID=UPI003CF672E8
MQSLSCVLLVDDDPTTNFLNQLLFKRLGTSNQVLVALNGQEALDLLQQHCHEVSEECPALILLDVKMPVMDGFSFLEAYEKLPITQKQAIIIVMLTTSLHPQDVERVEKLNIAGFLNKPLTEDKLNQVLEKYLNR